MGGFNFNFGSMGKPTNTSDLAHFGGTGSTGGGSTQNQFSQFPSMTPTNMSTSAPSFSNQQPPQNFPTAPPFSGYPYFGGGGSLTPIAGSVGAADKLPGGAGTSPTLDPRFTQMLDMYLGGQLGSGINPFNLQSYLPSTGGTTGQGQVAAPLNPQLQQLQQFLMTGTGGGVGMGSLFNLAQTGGLGASGLGDLGRTGGLQGMLGDLAQNGGQAGALGAIGSGGGLSSFLGQLYQTGGLGNTPLGDISRTGGLNGNLGLLQGDPLGMFGNLPQTGGLSGVLGNLAQTGGLTGSLGQMAQTGSPISALPEWQAMLNAQKTNIGQSQANLKEQFASMGNLSSSPAANAMALFNSQTTADQNSLLGQLQTQALENAQGRSLQAGEFGVGTQSQLGQFGVGNQIGLGQFGTNLESQLGQFGIGNQMQTGEFGAGLQAQIGQQGVQNQLSSLLPSLQAQLSALQGGVGTQLSADTTGLGAQLQSAQGLGQLGANLGQFTQGLDQQSIQNLMQEYFMTAPQNNPLNNQMFGLGTTFAPTYTKQGGVGAGLIGSLGSILSGAGNAAGGFAALAPFLAL